MTNQVIAVEKFALRASRGPRTTHTLRRLELQEQLRALHEMDAARKTEIGERIKALREDSPYTQPAVADRVGVTLRAYQKWEAGGGITYENAERLADIFGVSIDFVLKGDQQTPEPFGNSHLARVEDEFRSAIREILDKLDAAQEAREAMQALVDQQNTNMAKQTQLLELLPAIQRVVDALPAAEAAAPPAAQPGRETEGAPAEAKRGARRRSAQARGQGR